MGNAYRAFALDIGAFESADPPFNVAGGAVGPGLIDFLFEDGFLASFPIAGNDASANIFNGGAGNDTLQGGTGTDVLDGGDGGRFGATGFIVNCPIMAELD